MLVLCCCDMLLYQQWAALCQQASLLSKLFLKPSTSWPCLCNECGDWTWDNGSDGVQPNTQPRTSIAGLGVRRADTLSFVLQVLT